VATAPTQALPPGPRLPTLAQSAWWSLRPAAFLDHAWRRYGDTFTVALTQGGRWVFVAHPEDVRTVFTSDPRTVAAGATHELLEPVFGPRSVHLIDGEDHLRQRRMLLPPLHGRHLDRYAELVAEIAEDEIRRWPVGREFAVWPRMQAITLETIMRGIFGLERRDDGLELRRRIEAMLRLTMQSSRVAVAGLVPPWLVSRAAASPLLAFRRVMAALHAEVLAEVARRRAAGDDGRDDALSLLLRARDAEGRPLDDDELRDNLITLVVAGHETTATALTWAVHALTRNGEALERLAGELEEGGDAYLDAVVRETLRLHPAVPLAMRHVNAPLVLRRTELPGGTNLAVSIHLLHRLPTIYPEPHRFLPERFLDARPDSYAWAPFGGGTRRCLGASVALLEMKVVLRTLVTRRELSLQPDARPEAVSSVALRPSRGGRISLREPAAERPRATAGTTPAPAPPGPGCR
jgi:cytochrome P450 family 135